MKIEDIVLNEKRQVILTAYIQDIVFGKRPAVMILPGGGYQICAPRESEPAALAFLKAGFNAFVLKYSVEETAKGNAAWPNPLCDYEQAMQHIKMFADQYDIDPEKIAVVGFSAGGHLACAAAAMAKQKPAAAVLGYPVTGDRVKQCGNDAPDIVPFVTEETCPCFVFAARDDDNVQIMESLRWLEALAKNGVPFESHIYSHGPHAFSTCDASLRVADHCPRIPNWTEDCISWLREIL